MTSRQTQVDEVIREMDRFSPDYISYFRLSSVSEISEILNCTLGVAARFKSFISGNFSLNEDIRSEWNYHLISTGEKVR